MEIDLNFNKEDWTFERSSGYAGWRNIHNQEWIYEAEYMRKVNELQEYIDFEQMCNVMNLLSSRKKFSYFKENGFTITRNKIK